jgi:hypothetical protein
LLTALSTLVAAPLAHGALAASGQEPALEFPKASPPALVREQVGLTTIEIEYSRPSAKGRQIFGGLVPYDTVWRTGANAATKITFDTEVTFGGTPVSAGSYALFTIPGQNEWTVVLNENTEQWGAYGHEESKDVARIQVKPAKVAEPIETLTIGLGNLRSDSAVLNIAWETTRVPVKIQTNLLATLVPQIEATMAGNAEQKPWLPAAMFYYEHDLDIAKAVEWVDAAEQAQPDAPWVVYRKGLILAKSGDKKGALAAAKRSLELAKQAGGVVGDEYTRLSEALIASLQ